MTCWPPPGAWWKRDERASGDDEPSSSTRRMPCRRRSETARALAHHGVVGLRVAIDHAAPAGRTELVVRNAVACVRTRAAARQVDAHPLLRARQEARGVAGRTASAQAHLIGAALHAAAVVRAAFDDRGSVARHVRGRVPGRRIALADGFPGGAAAGACGCTDEHRREHQRADAMEDLAMTRELVHERPRATSGPIATQPTK